MVRVQSCPNRDTLPQFLLGHLAEDELEQVQRHLLNCEACLHTLQSLQLEDTLTEAMRTQTAVGGTEEESVEALVEKLSGLQPFPGEPVAETLSDPGLDAAIDLSFLKPTSKPGLLGCLGQYEIQEIVGQGGMGVVLKAFDPVLQRIIAIKVLGPRWATNATARKRFVREARAAAAVRNEHVISLYAVEEAQGQPYLVMEYVPGISLQQRLDQGNLLETDEILRIATQIATGLAAAHAQGLIHRDVKPANILLEAGRGHVKITDFGLARAVDDASLTQRGVLAGTPRYMAPEQAQGCAVDHRADLFSLGCVLYELCAGRPAFRAEGTLATLKQVCEVEPEPIPTRSNSLPGALTAIVRRLLRKDPDARYQSAAEVVAALSACAGLAPDKKSQRRRVLGWKTLTAAGLFAGAIVLAAQVVVRIRDKDGNQKEIPVAEGSTVTIEKNGSILAQVPSPAGAIGEIRCFKGHVGHVWSVALTPSGDRILSAGADASVRVWNSASGKEEQHFEGHHGCVRSVAIDPGGVWALSADGKAETEASDWKVCLWEIEAGKERNHVAGHGPAITCVAVAPDGRRVLFGSYDGTVWLYNVDPWKEVRHFSTPTGLWSLAFSADIRQALVAGGSEGRGHLSLCDLETGKEKRSFKGHSDGVWRAAWAADDKIILSVSIDGTVRIWDADRATELGRLRHLDGIAGVSVSADGKRAVSGGYDKAVRLWDVDKRKELFCGEGHTGGVQSVALSRDGKYAVSGSFDGTVRLWRLPVAGSR